MDLSRLRARLWALAQARPDDVARAAAALYGRAPDGDEWADLLDLVAVDWLDAEGRTLAEALATEPGLGDLERWPLETHTSLWVVDGWENGDVLIRDLVDDREVAVRVSASAQADLPRRTVLRARTVPWQGATAFFGDPGLYGESGVIARLKLLEAWRESPEPAVLAGLRARRVGFARQRDQRRVFLAHFGRDLVEFASSAAMEQALAEFMEVLLFVDRGASGTGPTRAEAWRGANGSEPTRLDLRLGDTLAEGRPALWFHAIDGFLLLPAFGELSAHLHAAAEFPDVLRLWILTPDLPVQALAAAGPTRRIAEALSVPDAPLSSLLPARFSSFGPPTPSPLPEFEDRG